jgi:hypothetical protein
MTIILIKYKYDNKYLPNININTFLIYSLYFLSYWTILKLIGRSIIIVSTKNIKLNKNDCLNFHVHRLKSMIKLNLTVYLHYLILIYFEWALIIILFNNIIENGVITRFYFNT